MFHWPKNGKVIIIDDKIEEAMPLINILSKSGISSKYYNGDADLLPEDNKSEGLTIVFADIVLTEGLSQKDKTGKVAGVVSELIKEGAPYILLPWSKHTGLTEQLKEDLKQLDVEPICTIPLDKWEYYESNGGEITFKKDKSIEELEEEILGKLDNESLSMVPFIFSWDNSISECSNKIICLLNELKGECPEGWNIYFFNLLMNFSKSVQGKRFNIKEIEKNLADGVLILNKLFIDYIQALDQPKEYPIKFPSEDLKAIPYSTRALINSRLLTKKKESQELSPGALFKIENEMIKEKYFSEHFQEGKLKSLFKKSLTLPMKLGKIDLTKKNITKFLVDDPLPELHEIYLRFRNELLLNKVELLALEVTPNCDYAQEKVVFSRFLMGLKLNDPFLDYKPANDVTYVTPLLEVGGGTSNILFDSKYFYSPIDKSEINGDYIFHFESSLLLDIQAEVTKHMNRPGIINL